MFRGKKFLLASMLVMSGCIMGTVVAEIALRVVAPTWLIGRMKELNVGGPVVQFGSDAGIPAETTWDRRFVRFTPFSRFMSQHYEFSNTVNIDEWGGRVVGGNKSKSPEHYGVVPFLGDSMAFGVGVEDSETYISLINSKTSIRYLNLAVPGSSLPNHLDIIELRHKELHSPSLYVFSFFVGNDFSEIVKYYYSSGDYGSGVKEANRGVNQDAKEITQGAHWAFQLVNEFVYHNRFLKKSYFLQFIKIELALFYNSLKTIPVMNPIFLPMSGNVSFRREAEESLVMAVQRLGRLSDQLSFESIFIIVPDRHQVDRVLLESKAKSYAFRVEDLDVKLPNKMIGDELRKNGIFYIDVLECLEGRNGLYYVQDHHLTPAGHRAVAECLSGQLNEIISSHFRKRE